MIKKFTTVKVPAMAAAIATAVLAAPSRAFAQDEQQDVIDAVGGPIDLQYNFGFTTLSQAINTIISLIFLGAGLLAFFFILMGAFNYLSAGDDSSKTEKARKQITNAVIGLILVALVYVIWLIAINLVPGLDAFFVTA